VNSMVSTRSRWFDLVHISSSAPGYQTSEASLGETPRRPGERLELSLSRHRERNSVGPEYASIRIFSLQHVLEESGLADWDVTFDPVFAAEAKEFPRAVRLEIAAMAGLLKQFGPQLRRPHCDTLHGSKHQNMKELRFSLPDGEWRIGFAFDPRRQAILLVGGSKSGTSQTRFNRDLIRVADMRCSAHLDSIPPNDKGRK
jgi:hypothetical protein